jgi:hypothetical protein
MGGALGNVYSSSKIINNCSLRCYGIDDSKLYLASANRNATKHSCTILISNIFLVQIMAPSWSLPLFHHFKATFLYLPISKTYNFLGQNRS